MGEPAWQGAGQEVGLKIWRIVVWNPFFFLLLILKNTKFIPKTAYALKTPHVVFLPVSCLAGP